MPPPNGHPDRPQPDTHIALKIAVDPPLKWCAGWARSESEDVHGERMQTRATDPSGGGRLPMIRPRHEQALIPLARALRQQLVGARAVLLVADALDLPTRDLHVLSAGQIRAALRRISVGTLGDVIKAISLAETQQPTPAQRVKALSLDAVARFVLDRNDPGSKLDLIERAVVANAMSACSGNQSAAARLLGIERKALARRLVKVRSTGPRQHKRVRRAPPRS
jgi:DNA-binding protein Fis